MTIRSLIIHELRAKSEKYANRNKGRPLDAGVAYPLLEAVSGRVRERRQPVDLSAGWAIPWPAEPLPREPEPFLIAGLRLAPKRWATQGEKSRGRQSRDALRALEHTRLRRVSPLVDEFPGELFAFHQDANLDVAFLAPAGEVGRRDQGAPVVHDDALGV